MSKMKGKSSFIYYLIGLCCCLMQACTPQPKEVQPATTSLEIYPAYQNVTIPVNIAPLNFLLRHEGTNAVSVTVSGKDESIHYSARGNKVEFPLKKWKQLLEAEKGNQLNVVVKARINDGWVEFPPFQWMVMPEPLDAYITYRLIEPGYEVWNALQLRERCVENFDERILADNRETGGQCMNCHIHGDNRGDLSLFHLRGEGGGTILNRNGELRKLTLKNEEMVSAAVYGDIHKDGRYGVFSSNIIIPAFHTLGSQRLEVYDTVSDLAIADWEENRMIQSPLVADSAAFETFPVFSADGKWVYFCSAPVVSLPEEIRELKYSLCRIAFDAEKGEWGNEVDTLWSASAQQGSCCHPKASADGRYLLYTVADYGTFPIWHRETDLQMMDLQTGDIDTLEMVNSNRSETYHSWSSNSRWFAFASKRGDGQYGRVYFAYVDADGKVHRPFVLPQQDPENDDLNLKSYNIPDLSSTPVTFDKKDINHLVDHVEAERFD